MSYEPKGSVKVGLDAMDADPQRIWSSKELAEAMKVPHSSVSACFDIATRRGAVFRRMGPGGTVQWRRTPFSEDAPQPLQVPTVRGFVPAPMPVPRAGSDVRHENPRPPKLCTGCSKTECWDNGCQQVAADAQVVASPAPEPEPEPRNRFSKRCEDCRNPECLEGGCLALPDPPGKPESEDSALEEQEEADEPDAYLSCRTGQIVLVGLEPDEEGRITIPAELVNLIKRQIAWSPAR